MGETFKIGIADMATCNPPDKVTTLGLGSCVGIVLYDPVSKKCGMVHVCFRTVPKSETTQT